MKLKLEEVYKTEGVPEYTFVNPPNFNEILVDLRNPRKPVIVEGQSGTGKTTVVKRILETDAAVKGYVYLTARNSADIEQIIRVSEGSLLGSFIINDFHRLSTETQQNLANLLKAAAEESVSGKYPRIAPWS